MAKVQNGEEILPKVSALNRAHERYRRRQTISDSKDPNVTYSHVNSAKT